MKLSANRAVSVEVVFHDTPGKGYAGYLSDTLISVLLFLGAGGAFYTMFSLSAAAPALAAAGVLAAAAGHFLDKLPRFRMGALLALAVCAAAFLAVTWEKTVAGMNLAVNQIADVFGEKNARLYAHYPVSAAGSEPVLCETFFLLLAGIVLAVLAVYLVKGKNLMMSAVLLAAYFVLALVSGREAQGVWLVLWAAGEALLLLRAGTAGHTVRAAGDGRTLLAAGGFFGLFFLILAAALILTGPDEGYQKAAPAAAAEEKIRDAAERFRYEKEAPSSLPEGDFTELGDLELKEVPALEVVMSHPDSLYLRGYVGSVYNGNGWEEPDGGELYENANLFYWLHKNNFFGQVQLAQSALELDGSITAEELNTITVNNQNASSKYIYAPYEVCNADETLLNAGAIGDTALRSEGFWGNRNYTYTALPNQVKRYTELVSSLYERQEDPTEELGAYLISESHYNTFVYDTFTQLPENVEELLKARLGTYETNGEAHASYQTAKQSILDYLTENVTYSETPAGGRKAGTDFLQYFLENSGEGYSVHYATAATLMFRYYGIPARYVEGYIITPEDVEGALDYSAIQVDGTRAHAWTEFYQDGIGWIPFEVTPPYLDLMEQADLLQGYAPQDGQEEDHSQMQDTAEEMTGDNYEENKDSYDPELREKLTQVLVFGILALLLAAVLLFLINFAVRRKRLRRRLESFRAPDVSGAACSLFAYTMELLEGMGLNYDGTSLYEMAPRVESRCGEAYGESFREAVHIYEEARYSSHVLREEQRKRLEELNEKLKQKMKTVLSGPRRFVLRAIKGLY